MKITSISCIKDDADIIETFIRVNSTFIDTFIFADDSKDETQHILEKLSEEGFNIIRFARTDEKIQYSQEKSIMGMIEYALKNGVEGDFFVMLDSDEFPKFCSKEHAVNVLTEIPPNRIGFFCWETYVPVVSDFENYKSDGLQNCFKKRLPEGAIFEKVVIPRSVAHDIDISVGSHTASSRSGAILRKHKLSENLAHFPVRSENQILKKNILATYWLMRNEKRLDGEGFHVFLTLREIIESNFNIPIERLRDIAFRYANPINDSNTELGEAPTWIEPYKLRYTINRSDYNIKNLYKLLIDSWVHPFKPEHIKGLL